MMEEYWDSGKEYFDESPASEPKPKKEKAKQRKMVYLVTAAAAAVIVTNAASFQTEAEPAEEITQQTEGNREPEENIKPEESNHPKEALLDVDILLKYGTWQSADGKYTAHFNEDGTGWWYDGEYFGRMVWREKEEGSVYYECAAAGPSQYQSHDGSFYSCYTVISSFGYVGISGSSEEDYAATLNSPYKEGDSDYYPAPEAVINTQEIEDYLYVPVEEVVKGTTWRLREAFPTQTVDFYGRIEIEVTEITFTQEGEAVVNAADNSDLPGSKVYNFPYTCLYEKSEVDPTVSLVSPDGIFYQFKYQNGGYGSFSDSAENLGCFLILKEEGPLLYFDNPFRSNSDCTKYVMERSEE